MVVGVDDCHLGYVDKQHTSIYSFREVSFSDACAKLQNLDLETQLPTAYKIVEGIANSRSEKDALASVSIRHSVRNGAGESCLDLGSRCSVLLSKVLSKLHAQVASEKSYSFATNKLYSSLHRAIKPTVILYQKRDRLCLAFVLGSKKSPGTPAIVEFSRTGDAGWCRKSPEPQTPSHVPL